MAKTIIYLADGTWDGPSAAPDSEQATACSNVFKLFLNLAGEDTPERMVLAKEQERVLTDPAGAVLQVAEYMDGIGDTNNFLGRLLDGTFGGGLITRIVRGYTFISRHFQTGDQIVIVGFSRGAYTARALAGLIAAQGLLDATRLNLNDRNAAYRLGSAVWYAHRRQVLSRTNQTWLGRLENFVNDLPGFVQQPPLPSQLVAAPIAAVAVWDTVGSYGIPEYTVNQQRLDTFQFADLNLSPKVQFGIHAVAVDERRSDFTPTLWNADPRIIQMLFPGSHCDVGGGFPTANNESGLSDAALMWMTDQLDRVGVRFAQSPKYKAVPDAAGVAHRPWRQPPWNLLLEKPRNFRPDLQYSQRLVERRKAGPVVPEPGQPPEPYNPRNLPEDGPGV